MAKKVTADEKLEKIVAFFKSKPEFYSGKDLDKLIPKICGISPLQVDDILTRATDEGLVNKEKLGGKNVYWVFEKQDQHSCACENERLELAIESYRDGKAKKEEHLKELKTRVEDTEERTTLIKEYNSLKEEIQKFEDYEKRKESCSKMLYNKNKQEIENMFKEINQITDNLFMLQSYMCKKYTMDRRDVNNKLGIPNDLDYIE